MGLFSSHTHKWKKYGRAHDGIQQWRCTKCGRVRNKKASQFWCSHRWRKDRRSKKTAVLACRKCGKRRTVANG